MEFRAGSSAFALLFAAFALASGAAQQADPDELFSQAVKLHQSGDLQGAVRAYEELLKVRPDNAEVWSNLGAAHFRLGDFGKAIEHYRRALELAPENSSVRYNLGLVYYQSGQIPQAAQELAKVGAEGSEFRNALILLADCRLRAGENKRVIELLSPHKDEYGEDRPFLYLLGTALIRDGRLREGQLLVDGILRQGDSPEVHLMLGSLRLMDFENRKALEEFDRALQLNPKLPSANALRGRALQALGDMAAAAEAFRKELEVNPTDFDSNLSVGVLLRKDELLDEAMPYFERALRIRPGHPAVRYQVANILFAKEKLPECQRMLEELVKETPDFLEVHITLAATYYQQGRKADGDREQEIVRELNVKRQEKNVAQGREATGAEKKTVPAPAAPPAASASSPAALAVSVTDARPAQAAAGAPGPEQPARRKAGSKRPMLFEEIAKAADQAREGEQFEEAIELYSRGLRLRPDWAEGWWYIGSVYYSIDRYAEARDAFSKLVSLKPKGGVGWAMLGLCQYQLREYERALEHLLRGRTLGVPADTQLSLVTRYHIALLQNRLGKSELAMQLLYSVVRQEGERPALIEAMGLSALMLPYLPHELPPDKREMVLMAGRAHYYGAIRKWEESRREADALLARYPEAPNVHYTNGVLLMKDNPDQGLEEFKRELKISPSHALARLQIAFEYIKRAEFEAALSFAEEAARLAPDNFVARYVLGQALIEMGQSDRAVQELEIAFKLAPDSPETCYQLARAYGAAGRDKDAARLRAEFARLDKIRRALKEGPQSIGLEPKPPQQKPPGG